MRKPIAAIAAASLLLTAAIGCHKTDVASLSGPAATRNTARILTGTDSSELVTNVKDFFDYADDRSHGGSGSPGGLSSMLSDSAANDLMEATLNYYYGVTGDDLDDSQWYTDSITISLNDSSTLDLSDVADGYNDALTQIKANYSGLGSVTDKRLEFVDVEVVDAGSNRIFVFDYKIGWNPVDPQNWTANSINIPFPSGTNLLWKDGGNTCSGTYTTLGAPYHMCKNIKNYFNKFYGLYVAVSTRDKIIPINIKKEFTSGASTATSNPFAAASGGVVLDYWTHYWASGTTTELNTYACIPTNGLNAYRSAIIAYIQARQTSLNQEFLDIALTGKPFIGPPARHQWEGTYRYANFISGEELANLE